MTRKDTFLIWRDTMTTVWTGILNLTGSGTLLIWGRRIITVRRDTLKFIYLSLYMVKKKFSQRKKENGTLICTRCVRDEEFGLRGLRLLYIVSVSVGCHISHVHSLFENNNIWWLYKSDKERRRIKSDLTDYVIQENSTILYR